MSRRSVSPSTRKSGCGTNSTVTSASPGGPPRMPGLPWPLSRIVWPDLRAGRNGDVDRPPGRQVDPRLLAADELLERHRDRRRDVLAAHRSRARAAGPRGRRRRAPKPPRMSLRMSSAENGSPSAPPRSTSGRSRRRRRLPDRRPADRSLRNPRSPGSAACRRRRSRRGRTGRACPCRRRSHRPRSARRSAPWPSGRSCSGRGGVSWRACGRPT